MIAFLVTGIFLGMAAVEDDASEQVQRWFAGYLGLGGLGLLTGIVRAFGVRPRDLVIGEDGRLSTSKLQAFLWTYALLGVLLTIIISKWLGVGDGYAELVNESLPPEYLILLGGPFAAAIASKAIVGTKVENGTLTKPEKKEGATPNPTERISEAVSDDDGNTSLVDTQYLLFNLLALIYFVGAYIDAPSVGLPAIPDVIFGLTSVSAATYVSNKAIQRETPILTSVTPSKAAKRELIRIFGQNLLVPDPDHEAGFRQVFIRIGGLDADLLGFEPPDPEKVGVMFPVKTDQYRPFHEKTGVDRFWVRVPEAAEPSLGEIVAMNYRGVESDAKPFEVAGSPTGAPVGGGSLSPTPAGDDFPDQPEPNEVPD